MPKLDLMRELKSLYSPPRDRFVVVEVPPLKLPDDRRARRPEHRARSTPRRFGALYSLAYTLKFQVKRESGGEIDFGVMPLEGLWWTEDMASFSAENKGDVELDDDDPRARRRHARGGRAGARRGRAEERRYRRWRRRVSRPTRRGSPRRSCTSARSAPRRRRSPGSTASSSRMAATRRPESTTRSTSPTRAERRRRS